MAIYESGEDYLQTILVLSEQGKDVHAIDIAKSLGFSKPSVSVALKKLEDDGYLEILDDNSIVLTKAGNTVASRILERHRTLVGIFESLGVEREQAEEDAHKVEHDLSDQTYELLKQRFDEFVSKR